MNQKQFILLGVTSGSFIGSLIPNIWGAGEFKFLKNNLFIALKSLNSLRGLLSLGNQEDGILGIWITYKLSR